MHLTTRCETWWRILGSFRPCYQRESPPSLPHQCPLRLQHPHLHRHSRSGERREGRTSPARHPRSTGLSSIDLEEYFPTRGRPGDANPSALPAVRGADAVELEPRKVAAFYSGTAAT